ncbi:MAG: hypothetical protein LIP11_07425 [Clostridiales bacterium]|nr:hypothetical protein [Clostridiales bacterium]
MFTIGSDRLRVEIAEPGEAPNNKSRFDRAGFISDVVLDGAMHFAASEPRNLAHPCSGGRGFCNEFRFDPSAEAQIGEFFPKFGIGLIRKEEDNKYIFHKTYKEIQEFPVNFTHTEQEAVFTTEPILCLGYAIRTVKTISVRDNQMTMVTVTENVGEKGIVMNEFCHNFISIDGMAVGSDYELSLPQCPDLGYDRLNNRRGFSGAMRGAGKGITFCEFTAIDTDFAIQGEDMEQVVPFTWRLSHRGARAYVDGADYFIPKFIAIWGVDHMVSPEVVHEFALAPGESHEWKRTWTFDTY